jgi:hypothetical protein
MPKADFSYEVRKLPADPVGVEDYVVRATDGEALGTVSALLERRGQRLLVVERGTPPLTHDRRALPWDAVDHVDHDAVAVWLTADSATFEESALELDPDRAVEEGEGDVEARRIDEPPADLIPPAQAGPVSGPVDRSQWAKTFAVFALFGFSVLVATAVVTFTGDNTWALLFLVPAALAAVAAVLGYRAYRNPYEPRGARKP